MHVHSRAEERGYLLQGVATLKDDGREEDEDESRLVLQQKEVLQVSGRKEDEKEACKQHSNHEEDARLRDPVKVERVEAVCNHQGDHQQQQEDGYHPRFALLACCTAAQRE